MASLRFLIKTGRRWLLRWGYAALEALLRHKTIGFQFSDELAFSLGFDGSRGNAVDANVVFTHLPCQTAGEANDGPFGGNVVSQVLQTGKKVTEAMFTTVPDRCRTMWGMTSLVQWKTLFMLMFCIVSHCSSVISRKGCRG